MVPTPPSCGYQSDIIASIVPASSQSYAIDNGSNNPRSIQPEITEAIVLENMADSAESRRCLQLDQQIQQFKSETHEIRRVALEAEQVWKSSVATHKRLWKEAQVEREALRVWWEADKASLRQQRRSLDSERERFRQRIAEDRACFKESEQLQQQVKSLEEELRNRHIQSQRVTSCLQRKAERLKEENQKLEEQLERLRENSCNSMPSAACTAGISSSANNRRDPYTQGCQVLHRGSSMPDLGANMAHPSSSSSNAVRLSASTGKGRAGVFAVSVPSKTGCQGDEKLKRPRSSKNDCQSDEFLVNCCDFVGLSDRTRVSKSHGLGQVMGLLPNCCSLGDTALEGPVERHPRPSRDGSAGECIRLVDGRTLVLLPDGAKREIAPDGTVLQEYHPVHVSTMTVTNSCTIDGFI